jgi:hypothetical protein
MDMWNQKRGGAMLAQMKKSSKASLRALGHHLFLLHSRHRFGFFLVQRNRTAFLFCKDKKNSSQVLKEEKTRNE